MSTKYAKWPKHPLVNIQQEVLDAARKVLEGAAEWNDVDASMVDPIADAVVIALVPYISKTYGGKSS